MTTTAQAPITDAEIPPAAITPTEAPPAASVPSGPPDGAAPVFVLLTTGAGSPRYRINEIEFARWCDELGEELKSELPEPSAEQPAGRLSSFADDAVHEGVIEPVAGLQLDVHGDDGCYDSGFYVMLSNTNGQQQHVYLTSGWNELYFMAEDTDPREGARDYLETLCAVANTVLDRLHPRRVAGAEASNILTLELSEGSAATWLLTDQRADAADAAITAACGPPDSLRC